MWYWFHIKFSLSIFLTKDNTNIIVYHRVHVHWSICSPLWKLHIFIQDVYAITPKIHMETPNVELKMLDFDLL